MKKLFALTLCAALAIPAAATALAADTTPVLISAPVAEAQESGYDIYVDGKDTGKETCITVPLRSFAEQLGFSVTWNGDGTVGIDNGVMHSTITIGQDNYQVVTSIEGAVGMSAPFSLGSAPFVADGTTYVPLQLFEALLGNLQGGVTLENGVLSIRTTLESEENAVQRPNPFTDCDSLTAAEKLVGFQLNLPDAVDGSDHRVFRAIKNDLLEVIYQKEETEVARIRKALGADDVSGDYTDYAQVNTVSVDDVSVTMKGENGLVALAIWTRDGYTYAVSVERPISSADMIRLIAEIQ